DTGRSTPHNNYAAHAIPSRLSAIWRPLFVRTTIAAEAAVVVISFRNMSLPAVRFAIETPSSPAFHLITLTGFPPSRE
ncbi:MAG: hypothetical protein KDE09_25870, partial [Anaerolineales bacterium]|nr:hypothetical protein [Anaerolineales bacterium]